jgi:protocatechuate 3,4-dioxygenase beta subunit
LLGCGGSEDSAADAGSGSNTNTNSTDSSSSVDANGFAVASGAFLMDKDYGNPFASGVGSSCVAYKDSTKGPCHSNTYLRKDISDGLVGLPTRFEFVVVDSSCNPVPNAFVEVWYASPAGTYSKAAEAIDSGTGYSAGSVSDLNVGFCTGNDATALASKWLRGFQQSDSSGRVTIDGIFPGWYSGRTTHVHFVVTANGHTSVTSQLFFDEALTTAIYTKHGSYSSRGNKNTTNAGADDRDPAERRRAGGIKGDHHRLTQKRIARRTADQLRLFGAAESFCVCSRRASRDQSAASRAAQDSARGRGAKCRRAHRLSDGHGLRPGL